MNINSFDFATVGRILFGAGKLDELPMLIECYGQKALVVRSLYPGNYERLAVILEKIDIEHIAFTVVEEPTIDTVTEAAHIARVNRCDFVIGIGGGSVIDTAKGVAALLTNGGDLVDYLEVIGKGLPIKNRCAPLVAIPTTAGTGSEVTRNAVIDVPDKRVKVSMRSQLMLPWVVIIDPMLTLSMPPQVTASTGLDAFIQVIEPFVSARANIMTDLFCLEGMRNAVISLRKVYYHGDNLDARTNMCAVSLFGGLALANAGLGAVHGIASVIGGMYNVAHGQVCASLLPAVMMVNISALSDREPESQALTRYSTITQIVTGSSKTTFRDGIQWFSDICIELNIPELRKLGIKKDEFAQIIRASKLSSSMKSNPIELNGEELLEILERAY